MKIKNKRQILGLIVAGLLVISMLIPGSYAYNVYADPDTSVTRLSNYLIAEPIMGIVAWLALAHGVYTLAFALWGILAKRNTAIYIFLFCGVLAYLIPANIQTPDRGGWLPFVPAVLCVLAPAAVFQQWFYQENVTAEDRNRWLAIWNIILIGACVAFLVSTFCAVSHREWYVVDGKHLMHKGNFLQSTSAQTGTGIVCVLAGIMALTATIGAVLKRSAAPIVMLWGLMEVVVMLWIDQRETVGFWDYKILIFLLMIVAMASLLSWTARKGGRLRTSEIETA